jgi:hypothetical protein
MNVLSECGFRGDGFSDGKLGSLARNQRIIFFSPFQEPEENISQSGTNHYINTFNFIDAVRKSAEL